MRILSVEAKEQSMETDFADESMTFVNMSSQTEDFDTTFTTP